MLLLLLVLLPNWLGCPKDVSSNFVMKKTVDCMADNLYHETRGEPAKGQLAVVYVVLNRVNTKRWGNSVCKVVYKPYQFSWTTARPKRPSQKLRNGVTEMLALQAIAAPESLGDDPSGGALWYHSVRIRKPQWTKNLHVSAEIANHVFYTERRK